MLGREGVRPVSMWAIRYGNGHIGTDSVRRTRRQAIEAFCDYPNAHWDFWRKEHGCRAVRVRIIPEPMP